MRDYMRMAERIVLVDWSFGHTGSSLISMA